MTMTTTKKTTRKTLPNPNPTSAKKTRKPRTPKAKVKLPPNPFVHEILQLVSEARGAAKKVELLKEYRNEALVSILIWNFDESVISMIPEGDVPYSRNNVPEGTDHTSLRRECSQLYHFVKGGNDELTGIRGETMFIQMLEGLHEKEAEIVCLVKDKKLTDMYKLTQANVAAAYPDIQWGDRS